MSKQKQMIDGAQPQPTRLRRIGRRALRELPWLLVLAAIYWAFSSSNSTSVAVGEQLPSFRAPQIGSGEILDTMELRGKPLVLVFWAPWCHVCALEMPLLGELQAAFGDRASVVGVGLSGSKSEMEDFAEKHGAGFPQVEGNQQISATYGIRAFPTLYILDAEGRLHEQFVGLTTSWRVRWTVSRMLE